MYHLRGAYKKDHSLLWSILRSPYLVQLPSSRVSGLGLEGSGFRVYKAYTQGLWGSWLRVAGRGLTVRALGWRVEAYVRFKAVARLGNSSITRPLVFFGHPEADHNFGNLPLKRPLKIFGFLWESMW